MAKTMLSFDTTRHDTPSTSALPTTSVPRWMAASGVASYVGGGVNAYRKRLWCRHGANHGVVSTTTQRP
jgi:hypothetical protein